MAKLFGLNGLLSGKLGNTVFAVTNGIQVARQYNPIVSNPKSSLQMLQRAKGNLCGRISSFVPRAAIAGLGSSNRARRAAFQRLILTAANATAVGDVYTAKIADEDVVFSKGSVSAGVVLSSITAESNVVTVALSTFGAAVIPADIYAALQTRLVVLVYDNTSQELVGCVTKIANKPAQGSSASTQIPIVYGNSYIAVVYAIPMSTADGSAVSIDASLASKSDSDIAAALSVNSSAVVFEYGNSYVLGSSSFIPEP